MLILVSFLGVLVLRHVGIEAVRRLRMAGGAGAIGAVQHAIQSWGKLTLVYQPSQADIIILVTSRPSEDVMAVYDGHQGLNGNYLWRVMGRDGLASGETPIVTQFEKGFDSVQKHK